MKYTDYYNHLLVENHVDKQIIEVPKAPGTVPIPSNHLRLYHYTDAEPEELKRHGLLYNKARGNTYGEPNFVWASLKQPGDFKRYVEFSVAIDDSRFSAFGARPDPWRTADFYKGLGSDFTFVGDIKPSEFIAIHEPWHYVYRYLVEERPSIIDDILNGKYDYLLEKDSTPREATAVRAVKTNFSS